MRTMSTTSSPPSWLGATITRSTRSASSTSGRSSSLPSGRSKPSAGGVLALDSPDHLGVQRGVVGELALDQAERRGVADHQHPLAGRRPHRHEASNRPGDHEHGPQEAPEQQRDASAR